MEQTSGAGSGAATPTGVVAKRVRELRRRREWSAERLAEELTKLGIEWNRGVVTKLETGRRESVSVAELLALALALDVAPVNLLVSLDDQPYQVTPNRVAGADQVRSWVRGQVPLPGVDMRTFLAEVSFRDLRDRHVDMYGETPGPQARIGESGARDGALLKELSSDKDSEKGNE